MLFQFIFPLFFMFTAITAEEYQMANYWVGQTQPLKKLKHESLPMPRPVPGKPLTVNVSVEIKTASIDDEKKEFQATFFFRQEWKDPRLAFESKDKEEFRLIKNPASIWTPDLFFVNNLMNETNPYGKVTTYIKHFPDGRVLTAERKTVKTSCSVNLRMYPFDTQTCQLQIESYGHTTDDIIVQWNESEDESAVTENLLSHDFVTSIKSELDTTKFRGAEYSSLRMVFSLSRTPTAVIFRVILPIAVIAICSWTSYLFSRKEIGVRITLCISPILTYLLQINFCTAFFISPRYLTSLDVWAYTSCVAMFISSFECLYIMLRKGPGSRCSQEGSEKSNFKDRIALALFVIGLDILSVISVFLSRLL